MAIPTPAAASVAAVEVWVSRVPQIGPAAAWAAAGASSRGTPTAAAAEGGGGAGPAGAGGGAQGAGGGAEGVVESHRYFASFNFRCSVLLSTFVFFLSVSQSRCPRPGRAVVPVFKARVSCPYPKVPARLGPVI